MKWSLIAGIALAATLVGPAGAADLPFKEAYVGRGFSWTGCYIGAQAGGGGIHDSWTDEHGNGALAGGYAGCNYQHGMMVFGIEGDGFWSGMESTASSSDATGSVTATTKNKYDFDIAGRFGIALNRTLIYVKGGWVWGKFDFRGSGIASAGINCNPGGQQCDISPGDPFSLSGSANLNGLLIGTGFEYALTNSWLVRAEYNYLNFGSRSVPFTLTADGTSLTASRSVSADKHLIKIGLSYMLLVRP